MPPRLYRGHRSDTWYEPDLEELVEIRARQRTFDGAYGRTALGNLGYSLAILKLFDRRFYSIGLLYAVLSGLLFVVAFFRSRHSKHDFADSEPCSPAPASSSQPDSPQNEASTARRSRSRSVPPDADANRPGFTSRSPSPSHTLEAAPASPTSQPLMTKGCENKRVLGPPFRTAGDIVVIVTVIVAAVEIALLVELLRL